MKPHEILAAIPHTLKLALDGVAGAVTITAIINMLPSIAAGFSIAWFIWQMIDRIKYGPAVRRKRDSA